MVLHVLVFLSAGMGPRRGRFGELGCDARFLNETMELSTGSHSSVRRGKREEREAAAAPCWAKSGAPAHAGKEEKGKEKVGRGRGTEGKRGRK
jgi:hypothetical protein